MINEDPESVVRQYNELVWNKQDMAAIARFCHEPYLIHSGTKDIPLSIPDHAAMVQSWITAFPDCHWHLDDFIVQDERVVGRFHGVGTHRGLYWHPQIGTILPTGKQVRVMEVNIYRVVDGRLAECWPLIDWFDLFMQLGAIRATASTPET
jgi:predicted ester cyclase